MRIKQYHVVAHTLCNRKLVHREKVRRVSWSVQVHPHMRTFIGLHDQDIPCCGDLCTFHFENKLEWKQNIYKFFTPNRKRKWGRVFTTSLSNSVCMTVRAIECVCQDFLQFCCLHIEFFRSDDNTIFTNVVFSLFFFYLFKITVFRWDFRKAGIELTL